MDKTLAVLFYEAVKKYPDNVIYRYKNKDLKFQSITYKDFYKKTEAFAAGLISLNLDKKKMAIISDNCIEWMMSVIANMGLGGIDIPRGINTHPDELKYILKHADADFICVQNKEALDKLDKLKLSGRLMLIVFDIKDIKSDKMILSFDDVCKKGRALLEKNKDIFVNSFNKTAPDDPASIIYTSGTTGIPKGVLLSHKNLAYSPTIVPGLVAAYDTDKWMSILPLWHVGERFFEFMAIIHGITLVLSSVFAMREDMLKENPDLIPGVPLVWKKIMDAVIKGIEESGKGKIFRFFYDKSLKFKKALRILMGLNLRYKRNPFVKKIISFFLVILNAPFHIFAKRVIYKKVIEKTGAQIRTITSGGGRLQNEVEDFFDIMGFNVIDGYGSTETAVIVAIRKDRHVEYTIGGITPRTEYKIIDQDTGRLCGIGEPGILFVKGEQVFKGYYKNEKAANEVFDKDGFYNTGDIVKEAVTKDIVFVGRAKDTIVMLNGENVEPEPFELMIENIKYVKHAVLTGQDKEELSVLIVPDIEALKAVSDFKDIVLKDRKHIAGSEGLKKFFKDEIKKIINTNTGFKIHELIKKVIILPDDFETSIELTNTMKKKRKFIMEKYKDLVK